MFERRQGPRGVGDVRVYPRVDAVLRPGRVSLRSHRRPAQSGQAGGPDEDDQLADAAQGLHQRAVLRGHRYFGADGKEGGARAPVERRVQEHLKTSLYQEPMTRRLLALVLTAVPNLRKSRKPLFSQYIDCINLALCDTVTHLIFQDSRCSPKS